MFERLFATRKSPYFPTEKKVEILSSELSGTKVELVCPKPSIPEKQPSQKHLVNVNVFDNKKYEYLDKTNQNLLHFQRGAFPRLTFVKRDWGLWGSVFDANPIGILGFSASVMHADSMPESFSCFIPKYFEQVVMRQLYYSGGPGNIFVEEFVSPVNWHIRNVNSREWIAFEIQSRFSPSSPTKQFFSPIGKNHFLRFSFSISGYQPKEFCLKNMGKIIDGVMSKVRVELDGESKLVEKKARDEFPGSELSRSRNPESWSFFEYDYDFEKVLKHGSQPADWVV